MKDKVKIFSISVFLVTIIGGSYLYAINLGKKGNVPIGPAIVATLEVNPSKIEITKDVSHIDEMQKATLTVKITNNTKEVLSDVYLVIPAGIDIGTIESSNASRLTGLPQQGNDAVFNLGDIMSKKTIEKSIWVYSPYRKKFIIKADIETNERYRTNTNEILLTVD
ncbi:MAG: hypothetical protein HYT07_02335 [Candidatus Levybacteria bacterium]|nr:hypothetical protein [Candidatus Levybacteria bacterium]